MFDDEGFLRGEGSVEGEVTSAPELILAVVVKVFPSIVVAVEEGAGGISVVLFPFGLITSLV